MKRSCLTLQSALRSIVFLALLSLLPVGGQLLGAPLDCQKTCVCASNIISCSKVNLTNVPVPLPKYTSVLDLSFNSISRLRAEWTPVPLGELHTLLLSHNGLSFLSSEAFVYVTGVRYLDLSSNELRQLDEYIFEPLEKLEVLLLYKNCISQIDRSAFSGLAGLQKLYLSQNQISRFPLELVKERTRIETLTLLDVSSNKIKTLTIHELQALPAWIKNGLYFHNNPLPCSCDLFNMVALWQLKDLSSVVDFKDEHTCMLAGTPKRKVATLDLDKAYFNCSEVKIMDREAYLEQFLVLDCDTKQRDMVKSWVLPGNMPVSLANKTASMLLDGNLKLGPLKEDNSGVYTCYATGDSLNETLYVTVVVFNTTMNGSLENLKTAYTTLIACLVSIVLVFIYLYLTPCQCACCPGQDLEKNDPTGSLHSSTVSIAQANQEMGDERGEGEGRDFPYDTKDLLEQNGRLNPLGEDEEWKRGDTTRRLSVSSVSSDTPMVV
ncbi:amphoterin-induced protein 1-like [Dunckerocampus dactyliophorus]|uniref:amphoterin-induced protein 1-like n=1 Tax=Dunckerocampus dactyliophorus TaxID=161453 RepID=UPI0024059560|nr:amphoterin-induced protein 1-like [Dunckerocampus dactyliophorus]XP_054639620.1 amphoterin-induced protein 1-like [Dunckerocampus dactyliophorus]